MRVVTEEEFTLIKSQLKSRFSHHHLQYMHNRSRAVIAKIAAAKTYTEYKEIVQTEHIPSKHPRNLSQRIEALERAMSIVASKTGVSFLGFRFSRGK